MLDVTQLGSGSALTKPCYTLLQSLGFIPYTETVKEPEIVTFQLAIILVNIYIKDNIQVW